MIERDVTVTNRAGIHARPAALIVQTAAKYQSQIMFTKDGEEINAKSIMGIITLGAAYQAVITIRAEGSDEQDAVDALATLFDKRFEEE
ncbi:MAG: HPr family phosphocarrier protein [Spirochaetaceae bacterium]|nr:MAG: HPr family phosphocarrier protein [Spirochaetaceae bacterium]